MALAYLESRNRLVRPDGPPRARTATFLSAAVRRIIPPSAAQTSGEMGGGGMSSYVSPRLQTQFESLSVDLKNEILSRNVRLENLHDLIAVLEQIVQEGEGNR